jgi:hypothetical protein
MTEKPATPEPKRRWYQFRLRTLLIGVLVLSIPCGYLAHEWRIVAARKAWLEANGVHPPWDFVDPLHKPPFMRRLFGDEYHKFLDVESRKAPDGLEATKLFPEAELRELLPQSSGG